MNKKLLIGIIGIVVLIGAAFGYVLASDGPKTDSKGTTEQAQSHTPAPPADQPAKDSGSATAVPGQYIPYNEPAVASTQGRKLLFFHAPWCPQCRELDASIQAQGVPANTTIFKVDYDSATALRQTYGVTIQTTIVEVGPDGQELRKHVAYDQPTLAAVLKALE